MTVSPDGLLMLALFGQMDSCAQELMVDVAKSLPGGTVSVTDFANAIQQRTHRPRRVADDSPFAAQRGRVVQFRQGGHR